MASKVVKASIDHYNSCGGVQLLLLKGLKPIIHNWLSGLVIPVFKIPIPRSHATPSMQVQTILSL